MNLYECSEIERQFDTLAEKNEGIISPEDLQALILAQTTALESVEKLLNYVAVLEAQSNAASHEIERLEFVERACNTRIDSIKEYIKPWLVDKGGKFKVGTWTLSTRKSTAVQLADDFNVKEYMVTKVSIAPDKRRISDDLKAGTTIAGAVLVERQNVQIK